MVVIIFKVGTARIVSTKVLSELPEVQDPKVAVTE